MNEVRVRFAPSPTGPLHLGGVRTALFDYLFAKKNNGKFILRIEDTDSARYVPGAEEYIYEALEWCGLVPDESPVHGGAYGPYRQSDRRDIYDTYTAQILKTDYAYLAFDTPEELEEKRKEYEAGGQVFSYGPSTRSVMKNSISLSDDEVQKLLDEKVPYAVRFKMPTSRVLHLEDEIRGHFSVNTDTLDDKVLVKHDGMPTYHFANIIDDHEMKISHVIRGEEWLPSMPLHILLYEAMGWEAPKFAHLPLILKPEGKGKLSKRDGDKFGFPVFPLRFTDPQTGTVSVGYREQGYLPGAFINFLALLGWSPGENKEILSLEEMSAEFDLEKIHKSGARFSKEKAEWFNHQYLQQLPDEELLSMLKALPEMQGVSMKDQKLMAIIALLKERAVFPKDIYTEGIFFFRAPESYDDKAVKKAWKQDTAETLRALLETFDKEKFTSEAIHDALHAYAGEKSVGMGKIMMPLRIALVGELKGPDVPDIMALLGYEEVTGRVQKAIQQLG